MQQALITNAEKIELFAKSLKDDGIESLHVIADYDNTLTKSIVNGQITASLISILRDNEKYLGATYAQKAHAMYKHYSGIAKDPTIAIQEKVQAMEERRRNHFDLLIKSGLTKAMIDDAMTQGNIQLREGSNEFFDTLEHNEVPLIIFSAGGLGVYSIESYMKHSNQLRDNMTIIYNQYLRDSEGNAKGIQEPIIHSLNKDETSIRQHPIFQKVKNRKNVILLGDNVGDSKMIEGFDYKSLLKVCFIKDRDEEKIQSCKPHFDVLIIDDGGFGFLNELLSSY